MESLLVGSGIFNFVQIWRCGVLGMAVHEVGSSILAAAEIPRVPGGLKRVCGLSASTKRGLVELLGFQGVKKA